MSAPTVEIVVPADARADASVRAMTGAMVGATAEALTPSARVQTVGSASQSADVVVTIQWSDGAHRNATLRVRMRDGRDAERTVQLAATDPDHECGRALGFAVAAMIPDDVRGADPPPATTPEPPPKIEERREAPVEAPRSILASRLWLDAAAQGATGIGGSASSGGGAIAVRLPLQPIVLRLGGAARFGEVSEADASSRLLRGDAGVGFYTMVVDPRVLAGARVGLVLLHHTLERKESDGRSTTGSHTLLGMETLVEGSFALSRGFAVLLGVGAELAFGSTGVRVGPESVATIPIVRSMAELGVRVAF